MKHIFLSSSCLAPPNTSWSSLPLNDQSSDRRVLYDRRTRKGPVDISHEYQNIKPQSVVHVRDINILWHMKPRLRHNSIIYNSKEIYLISKRILLYSNVANFELPRCIFYRYRYMTFFILSNVMTWNDILHCVANAHFCSFLWRQRYSCGLTRIVVTIKRNWFISKERSIIPKGRKLGFYISAYW